MEKRKRLITKAEVIKRAREAAGLSKSELARRVGVNLATVYRWEYNQYKTIELEYIDRLNRVIDVMTLYTPVEVRKIKNYNDLAKYVHKAEDKGFKEEEVIDMLELAMQEKEILYYE